MPSASSAVTMRAAVTSNGMGSLRAIRYAPASGSKYGSSISGISATRSCLARNVCVNSHEPPRSSPAPISRGTWKSLVSAGCWSKRGGREDSGIPVPLTSRLSVIGSPTSTSVGCACASISNLPIQPLKLAGRPAEGRSSTSKRGRLDGIARVSITGRPPKAPEKTPPPKKSSKRLRDLACPGRGASKVTVAAAISIRPDSRGTSSFRNRSVVYVRPAICP